MRSNMLEVKLHEILKVWVIADSDLRELLVHPDGHAFQFDSKQKAENFVTIRKEWSGNE